MRINWHRTLLLTAFTLTLGAAAYGQDNITATIPFAFRTADGTHAAGTYHVISKADRVALQLRNDTTGKSVLLPIGSPQSGPALGEARPRLVFHCQDDGGCVLTEVWTGSGQGWAYPAAQAKIKTESAVVVYYGGEATK